MIEMLISLLKASGADAWEITDTLTDGREYYFIRHELDQFRVKKVEHVRVQVFRKSEDGRSIGSAGAEIPPTADENAVNIMIGRLLHEAALLKNPAYSLHAPTDAAPVKEEETPDIDRISSDFIRVMRSLNENDGAYVNSYEIFVSLVRRRVINSRGVDTVSVYPDSMLEAVVNAREKGHEIELYRMLLSGVCGRDEISHTLNGALASGRDRLRAVPTPALGKIALVLPAESGAPVWEYYIDRMNASMKYQGFSDWETGQAVIPEGPGRNVTIRGLRHLDNSPSNAPYDSEGAPVDDITVIDRGRAAAWWGKRQFCSYLGLERSFTPGNFGVYGGEETPESILSLPCLEVIDFSDFQADPVTGSIAGEIRLGYLRDANGITPVTGGSVSGNMKDLAKGLSFTAGKRRVDSLLLPAYTRLEGVSITGAV